MEGEGLAKPGDARKQGEPAGARKPKTKGDKPEDGALPKGSSHLTF